MINLRVKIPLLFIQVMTLLDKSFINTTYSPIHSPTYTHTYTIYKLFVDLVKYELVIHDKHKSKETVAFYHNNGILR